MNAVAQPSVFSDAVRHFWRSRRGQAEAQVLRGARDQGSRGQVTGGGHLDGFVVKLSELMVSVGVRPDEIFTGRGLVTIPGFYRPTKQWDMVVRSGDRLLAAIEMKAQVGSFGNNVNNRAEEAIGNATDFWTAYREGAFKLSPQPWLGYLFLLQDVPAVRVPIGVRETHFNVFPEFVGASYARRYELLCEKLVRERQYSSACFLLADEAQSDQPSNYVETVPELSASAFIDDLLRHVARR